MGLKEGAQTVVKQCLNIERDEDVVVVTDGIDPQIINALVEVVEENSRSCELVEYPEPENQGSEPPEKVAEAMKNSDVFIAPTKKSLSHTDARREACEAGARGATMPGINREIWNGALQANYSEVKGISEKVYSMLEDTSEVRIKTPSGTDLRLDVDIEFFEKDTGIIHEAGEFGNLPAGEADGATVNAEGTLVIDHLVFAEDAEGAEVEIKENRAVALKHDQESGLENMFSEIDGGRNVAEFGFGTNPEAELIGNLLQDEKVLGTVHIAFGNNTAYVPEGRDERVNAKIHWDSVCLEPTVWFDDKKVLDAGEPTFL